MPFLEIEKLNNSVDTDLSELRTVLIGYNITVIHYVIFGSGFFLSILRFHYIFQLKMGGLPGRLFEAGLIRGLSRLASLANRVNCV